MMKTRPIRPAMMTIKELDISIWLVLLLIDKIENFFSQNT